MKGKTQFLALWTHARAWFLWVFTVLILFSTFFWFFSFVRLEMHVFYFHLVFFFFFLCVILSVGFGGVELRFMPFEFLMLHFYGPKSPYNKSADIFPFCFLCMYFVSALYIRFCGIVYLIFGTWHTGAFLVASTSLNVHSSNTYVYVSVFNFYDLSKSSWF